MMFNSIVRSRPLGTFLAQWRRQAVDSICKRRMCDKPPVAATETKPAAPTPSTPHLGFKLPGYRPSDFDKKMLIWSGRFKTKEQIPEIVSYEMLDGARNKVRVKVAYLMMAVTIAACVGMVILGKQGVKNHDSLIARNMEKKARWRAEAQQEREAAAASAATLATEKAQ
ncbi:protein FAM162B [Alosa sapidissima]|uniref:protein FAM162B n=1 Tax=Alosa sapidissima TaxID=34773 RepID=UPI001C0A33CB|nr:protein FAM162B [Alosa sapidissima]